MQGIGFNVTFSGANTGGQKIKRHKMGARRAAKRTEVSSSPRTTNPRAQQQPSAGEALLAKWGKK